VLAAERIFINVGGRASVPDMPGLDKVDFLTNSSILKLDFLPRHLIVIGGSYIGLEFAQIYRRFGGDVTVIEMSSRLVPREDEDVSAAIRDILEREGIGIRLDAKCIAVGKSGPDITAKKFGEEAIETALAAVKGDSDHVAAESADLIYHWLVLLSSVNVSLDEVAAKLEMREGTSGIAEKASRKGR